MKRSAFSFLLLCWSCAALAQVSDRVPVGSGKDPDITDRTFLERADFSDSLSKDLKPVLSGQIDGHCFYEPDNRSFARLAVKRYGLIPGLILTTDRMTRSGRIGTASHYFPEGETVVHEGLEAYSRTGKTLAPAVAAIPFRPPRPVCGVNARSISADFEFVNHLIGNDLTRDALALLYSGAYAPGDTLEFLRGWALYSSQHLEEASAEFDLVPSSSAFYDKSLFFNVISSAHSGNYDKGAALLDGYCGKYDETKHLERAGIALLQDDPTVYLNSAKHFTYSDFSLSEAEKMLSKVYTDRYCKKSKSPVLAAFASAAIPGLGKIYAGQTGEGVASFLAVGSLAAITAENWCKCGGTNWKTILFGTLGAAFYIGNIYGSYVSVSIYKDDLRRAQDTAVLYHIHIPLRSIFN